MTEVRYWLCDNCGEILTRLNWDICNTDEQVCSLKCLREYEKDEVEKK